MRVKYIVAPSRSGYQSSTLRLRDALDEMDDVEVLAVSELNEHLLNKGLGCVTVETDLTIDVLRGRLSGFIVEEQD